MVEARVELWEGLEGWRTAVGDATQIVVRAWSVEGGGSGAEEGSVESEEGPVFSGITAAAAAVPAVEQAVAENAAGRSCAAVTAAEELEPMVIPVPLSASSPSEIMMVGGNFRSATLLMKCIFSEYGRTNTISAQAQLALSCRRTKLFLLPLDPPINIVTDVDIGIRRLSYFSHTDVVLVALCSTSRPGRDRRPPAVARSQQQRRWPSLPVDLFSFTSHSVSS